MTSHLQWIKNYAARVILFIPMSSNITTHLIHLIGILSTTTVPAVLHHHMSLTYCCRKSHNISATHDPAHTLCLFSIDLRKVRHHFVIAHLRLLLLLSGTLFKMTYVSIEDILVSFSLQLLNFPFDICTYVYGLALLSIC